MQQYHKNALKLIEAYILFIANMFDDDRGKPTKSGNNSVQQADKGPVTPNE